jgi:hypothetical protein
MDKDRKKLVDDSESDIELESGDTIEVNKTATTSIWSSICHFSIILSAFLVVFVAFRNTLTW